jgi:GNAT superfamily N-acetyltransferase
VITISAATPADLQALAELMQEMDDFYGEMTRESLAVKADNIQAALFSDLPGACALLARQGPVLAGFASYSYLWPAVASTKSLYLKELYVRKDCRKSGIGSLLMKAMLHVAREAGCSRVEWTTDESNTDAREFYSGLGVHVQPSKLFYRAEV